MTPYQAQFGVRPVRSWTRYIPVEMQPDSVTNHGDVYLKIKNKRERKAEKANAAAKITTFKEGDMVLVRTYPISDALHKIMSKFCSLYEGPYRVKERRSIATYVLEHLDNRKGLRGIFNVRQLKPYHM